MINCNYYNTSTSVTVNNAWKKRAKTTYYVSILCIIGAAVFIGACYAIHPTVSLQGNTLEYALAIAGLGVAFMIGSLFCDCMSNRQKNSLQS